MTEELPLWPHQAESLEVYARTPVVFDMSDAGTGKTRASIEAFRRRRSQGGGRALIIAPKSLLEPAWGADFDKFAPELSYSVAYAENREEAFSVSADVYITNTDAVKWIEKQLKSYPKLLDSFDTLIIDESSYFKNRQSFRSKAMRKIASEFKYRALMTATPTSRSITDIWHQALILDGGQRLGNSFMKFRAAVCKPIYKNPTMPQYVDWEDKPEARGAVADLLHDITIRHDFATVMPHVPGNTEHYVHYKPAPKILAAYKKLKEEALLMLETGEVDAVNAAVLRQKLLQVASGSVYGTGGTRHTIDKQRIELACDLVYQRAHSVLFYNWDHQREGLVKALEARKIPFAEITSGTKNQDRARIVQEYQDGQYQTLLMHPQTGAHGLTLTRGTATIWMSPTDRADLLVQGKHRVLRGGQTEETENVMICALHTLEQQVYERTDDKRSAMSELMEMLK